jgi:hypothetical protein
MHLVKMLTAFAKFYPEIITEARFDFNKLLEHSLLDLTLHSQLATLNLLRYAVKFNWDAPSQLSKLLELMIHVKQSAISTALTELLESIFSLMGLENSSGELKIWTRALHAIPAVEFLQRVVQLTSKEIFALSDSAASFAQSHPNSAFSPLVIAALRIASNGADEQDSRYLSVVLSTVASTLPSCIPIASAVQSVLYSESEQHKLQRQFRKPPKALPLLAPFAELLNFFLTGTIRSTALVERSKAPHCANFYRLLASFNSANANAHAQSEILSEALKIDPSNFALFEVFVRFSAHELHHFQLVLAYLQYNLHFPLLALPGFNGEIDSTLSSFFHAIPFQLWLTQNLQQEYLHDDRVQAYAVRSIRALGADGVLNSAALLRNLISRAAIEQRSKACFSYFELAGSLAKQ